MEFEEVQSIWGAQDAQPIFRVDEKELHEKVLGRKKKALRITNISELILIFTYLGAGSYVWYLNVRGVFFMYLMAGWMIAMALLGIFRRVRRIVAGRRFDRTVRGELEHALAVARYQVKLSRMGRWNIILIGVFCVFGMWESGKSPWVGVWVGLFFVFTYYLSGFEHGCYKRQRERLEELYDKLGD
ncbi:hypothetical protein Q4E93_33905 [Flavitalea sp. BT771]|uniref:hypothetical protein n=1 Tax=Flavitalea sp. BT771 TaxID=3063329 RepID=UPI0026E2E74D|nr:hypothetical protein [Flavitalea sp. BT771]MDO6435658.1 hypothetical protein [Flavitalea sp. BT771]MDV6224559.1 hypothetical protein [Flavitalea sp. BT771]